MNSSFSLAAPPSSDAINALGNNIALVFAAAKESGQSEAVVREALALFNSVTTMPNQSGHMNLPIAQTSAQLPLDNGR